MKLMWLGHSAFILDNGRSKLIVDPFMSGNPACPLKPDDVDVDVVLVSHGHGDHLGDAVSIATGLKVPLVAIYELAEYSAKKGAKVIGMNFGGTVELSGFKVTMVPALHSSGITNSNFHHSGGTAAGFVIDNIYFAGDTCLFGDMALIGKRYSPEIALLPIGGLYTMTPEDAPFAAEMLGVKTVIPMHYNTWPAIEQNPEKMREPLESINVELVVPEIGVWFEV